LGQHFFLYINAHLLLLLLLLLLLQAFLAISVCTASA
jgi:hypothetical protein